MAIATSPAGSATLAVAADEEIDVGEPESLDGEERLQHRLGRHAFDRLVMLSDGVFAIAMTLLALEVKPARAEEHGASVAALWERLAPSVGAFALSFAVIAIFWLTHRRLFARLRRVDGRLTALGLLLLGEVALLPPATALFYQEPATDVIRHQDATEAWPLYLGLIALIGLTQSAMWAYASLAGLVHDEVTTRFRWVAVVSNAITPVGMAFLALYAIGTRSWAVSAGAFALGVVYLLLRRRLARPDPPRPIPLKPVD